jgi:hypothetical protein
MAETNFTRFFKNNLCNELNTYFNQKRMPLTAKTEYGVPTQYGMNFIDICVIHEYDSDALLGIEIEVISDAYQAQANRKKFRNWVHKSPNRCGGLLHIICINANISKPQLLMLLRDSYSDQRQNKGFFYEFYTLNIKDGRASKATAYDLLWEDEYWEFKVRLLALAHEVFDF